MGAPAGSRGHLRGGGSALKRGRQAGLFCCEARREAGSWVLCAHWVLSGSPSAPAVLQQNAPHVLLPPPSSPILAAQLVSIPGPGLDRGVGASRSQSLPKQHASLGATPLEAHESAGLPGGIPQGKESSCWRSLTAPMLPPPPLSWWLPVGPVHCSVGVRSHPGGQLRLWSRPLDWKAERRAL